MTSIADRKIQLEARRDALLGRLGGIKTELETENERDWEELATQHEDDEVLEGLGVEAQTELRAISAALARVEAGTYGICVKCGDQIGAARLDVLPYTPFCKECAE
ncbi:TraR/DksA family transcriptional regulator [bacterium]|nr:TraR/DksA family transcriptional regulator [bacterium]